MNRSNPHANFHVSEHHQPVRLTYRATKEDRHALLERRRRERRRNRAQFMEGVLLAGKILVAFSVVVGIAFFTLRHRDTGDFRRSVEREMDFSVSSGSMTDHDITLDNPSFHVREKWLP